MFLFRYQHLYPDPEQSQDQDPVRARREPIFIKDLEAPLGHGPGGRSELCVSSIQGKQGLCG